jgi:hypothetical protein
MRALAWSKRDISRRGFRTAGTRSKYDNEFVGIE